MRTLTLVFAVLLAGGLACRAELQDKTVRALQDAAASAGSRLELAVNEGCGGTYYEGDKVTISVTSPVRGYLYLLDFQADGDVVLMLFPSRSLWGDVPLTIEAGTTAVVPPRGGRNLAVSAPFGREAVFALVVPEEQVDLVALFDAYSSGSSGTHVGSEAVALSLQSLVISLKSSGQECAAGVCLFTCAPKIAETTPEKPVNLLLEEAAAAASSRLQLTVNDACGKTHTEGERLRFSVASPVHGYLYLFYFPPVTPNQDKTFLLFPNLLWWRAFPLTVKANTQVVLSHEPEELAMPTFSPGNVGFAVFHLFSAGEPLGEQLLFAFVVPEEQVALVNKWHAYDKGTKVGGGVQVKSYYGGGQRREAADLLTLLTSLRQRGVECAAGVCSFFAAERTATPSSSRSKTEGEPGP